MKLKKLQIISIVVAIVCSLFTMNTTAIYASGDELYGRVVVDSVLETVEFYLHAHNHDGAVVRGSFNGWSGNEYPLYWTNLGDDDWQMYGKYTFQDFDPSLYNQDIEYKFVLQNVDGNQREDKFWVNADGGDANSIFRIDVIEQVEVQEPTIFTPLSEVSAKRPLELISVRYDASGMLQVNEQPHYEVHSPQTGVTIKDGYLFVSENIPSMSKIEVAVLDEGYASSIEVVVNQELKDEVYLTYHKGNGKYQNWNIWSWDDGKDGSRYEFTGRSTFGATIPLPYPNFIVKYNEWQIKTNDLRVPNGVNHVYVVENDQNVYTSMSEAIKALGPKLLSSFMDSKEQVVATLSKPVNVDPSFHLYQDGTRLENVKCTLVQIKVTCNTIEHMSDFDPVSMYTVQAESVFTTPINVTLRNVLNEYYDERAMGATFLEDTIELRLFAPTAAKVEVVLYEDASMRVEMPNNVYEMSRDARRGTHAVQLSRTHEDDFYLYRLTFKDGKVHYAVDPYAVAVGVNGNMGALVDINGADVMSATWKEDQRPQMESVLDSILYELHVRDFTIDEAWGGPRIHAGKYLGLVEEGTYIEDEFGKRYATGLDHLKELGITTVHLLPTYDLASIDESKPGEYRFEDGSQNRNWGYDPKNYNVPEGSYSSDPTNPKTRILEYRQMVEGFHRAGIRVVNDVVYNHMYNTENMDKIIPGYYFRTWNDGTKSNGSGCGNEVASERPMVRKFIVDSVLHWVENYHIDGLRFDLMALMDHTTMMEIKEKVQAIDESIILYGEPWAATDSPLAWEEQTRKDMGIASFNDDLRNALRGDNNPSKGYVNDNVNDGDLQKILAGLNAKLYASNNPSMTINYVEAHDNYTLWDQIEKSMFNVRDGQYRLEISEQALEDVRVRKQILANAFVLNAQGIPFFAAGSEFLRTKQGDHNSYKSDDATNQLYWQDKITYQEVFAYYQGMIAFRKANDFFTMETAEEIKEHVETYPLYNDKSVIAQHYKNLDGEYRNVMILYNVGSSPRYVDHLPIAENGKWMAMNDDLHFDVNQRVATYEQQEYAVDLYVPANSMLILVDYNVTKAAERLQAKIDYYAKLTKKELQPNSYKTLQNVLSEAKKVKQEMDYDRILEQEAQIDQVVENLEISNRYNGNGNTGNQGNVNGNVNNKK